MLGTNYEVECIIAADGTQEFAMTSLGKLVFGDIYNRQISSSTEDDLSDSLSLAYENIFHMPFNMIEKHSATISTLDISNNKFSRNLLFLSEFDNLTSLNLDHNNVDADTVLPYMPKLELLWLNHNSIENLYPFVKNLYHSVPNLKYLCLMGNKAAPSYLNGRSFYDYLRYRLYVISWFPHLVHLDDRKVTPDQRKEAKRLFKRPLLEHYLASPVPECIKHVHNKITTIFTKSDEEKAPKTINTIV